MKSIWDYPITQPYGYDPNYPLNNGFHRGIDYGCPVGTPVTVNGVTIALSGASGKVFGAHCHVGRFVNGKDTDPQGGGAIVTSGTISAVGQDDTNGMYVKVQDADGSVWVYLHLSEIKVGKGDKLEGGDMFEGKSAQEWAQAAKDATGVAEARARYLAQIAQAAGDNPDHPLGQDDADKIVAHIDDLNKQIANNGTVLAKGKYVVQ